MFKNMVVLMAVFCFCFHSEAQTDQRAKELLSQVSAKMKSYRNTVAKFNYTLEDDTRNIKQKTKGSVESDGTNYRLELLGNTRIFDGEKLYEIIPEDEEINISIYHPDDDNGLSPSKMFYFYEKGYTYEWDIKQNVEGRAIQFIKLKPENKTLGIKEILLGIDVQTKHINKLIQQMEDGNKIIIDVASFKTNQPLSDKLFKFDENKYQGYYINRLD